MKKYLLLLLILNSCQIIHLINTKSPNNESKSEVTKFLKKKKYKFDENLFISDSLIDERRTNKYLLSDSNQIASFIEVRIFTSSGDFYTAFSQCYGDFKKRNFISGMPISKNEYPFFNQSLSFENELLILELSTKERQRISIESKKFKYSIIVYWNIWTNHFSKKVLKELSDFKAKHKDEVYLLFCNSAYNKKEKKSP